MDEESQVSVRQMMWGCKLAASSRRKSIFGNKLLTLVNNIMEICGDA